MAKKESAEKAAEPDAGLAAPPREAGQAAPDEDQVGRFARWLGSQPMTSCFVSTSQKK